MLVSQTMADDIKMQGQQQASDMVQVNRDLVETLLSDVDKKVSEKSQAMWQDGKLMMSEMQKKHREETEALQTQLRLCLERQAELENDNVQLKAMLAKLANALVMMGGSQPDAAAGMADFGMAAAGLCMTSPAGGASTTISGSVASASPLAASHGSSAEVFSSPANPLSAMSIAGFMPVAVPDVPAFPFPAVAAESAPSLAEMVGPPACAPGLSHPDASLGNISGDGSVAEGATRLSLADALGANSPERRPVQAAALPTPVSLADSLPAVATESTLLLGYDSNAAFNVTLQKYDGMSLGLNISHHVDDMCLLVEDVRPEGAVNVWNQQCAASGFPEHVVRGSDKIVSVNNITSNPELMLEECKSKPLLHFVIVRGERALAETAGAKVEATKRPLGSPGGLRADAPAWKPDASASEFVPMGFSMAAAN